MRSSITRAVASLATASLLTLGLGGCFLLPLSVHGPTASAAPSTRGEDAAAAPRTGDCWEATHRHLADWSSWEGRDPVPCSEPHQSYTYLVTELTAQVEPAYDSGAVTGELLAAASAQCNDDLEREFGWDGQSSRLGLYFFVPTEDEWDAGNRDIRCDVAMLDLGSDYLDPELADLPAGIDELIDDAASDGLTYAICVYGDGYGPYESTETELIDCDGGDYSWRLGGTIEFPADEGSAYPDADALYAYGVDHCPTLGMERGETPLPYTPTAEYWGYGEHSIECWFSLLEGPPKTA